LLPKTRHQSPDTLANSPSPVLKFTDDDILVTGGAGYVGSHTCLALAERGYTPIVYDNLVNGHREFVHWGPLEEGDVRDRERLEQFIRSYRPAAIIHFAGLIEVAESLSNPIVFFDNNVSGSVTLFAAALKEGIDKVVFSSTCATYGIPKEIPMRESHPQLPISPYGTSKLLVEQILRDLDTYQGLRSVILRYFKAAGADMKGRIGEWHNPESHVIPIAIDVARGKRSLFRVYGSDYPTSDGTCIRDFVHVADLADAHARSIDYLVAGGTRIALNLGTGRGTSVKQLVHAIEKISNNRLPIEMATRREGYPPELVADNTKAKITLRWQPVHELGSIVKSAWNGHRKADGETTKYAQLSTPI
jgi:UDP-glucose 4-epimerase